MSSYSEKLKDPRWQKLRLQVMERDGFACQLCFSTEKTLHIHHLTYRRNPWQSELSELITLCEDCHAQVESTLEAVRRASGWDVTFGAIESTLQLMDDHHPSHAAVILTLLARYPEMVKVVRAILVDRNINGLTDWQSRLMAEAEERGKV